MSETIDQLQQIVERQSDTIKTLRSALAESEGARGAMQFSLTELIDAMHRYEMNVDDDAPSEHRAMMDRAEKARSSGSRWMAEHDAGIWEEAAKIIKANSAGSYFEDARCEATMKNGDKRRLVLAEGYLWANGLGPTYTEITVRNHKVGGALLPIAFPQEWWDPESCPRIRLVAEIIDDAAIRAERGRGK